MRVEDLTKFEGECPNIVVFGTYKVDRSQLPEGIKFELK